LTSHQVLLLLVVVHRVDVDYAFEVRRLLVPTYYHTLLVHHALGLTIGVLQRRSVDLGKTVIRR
jgi:hypothetical protein